MRAPLLLRRAGVLAGVLGIALMTGWPVRAADHSATGKGGAHGGDPFGSCNTQLNAAASDVLHDVEAHPAAPPVVKVAGPRAPSGAPAAVPEGRWRRGRERVERLLPVIAPILRAEGVPVQLAAMVLVESGGNPMALSAKGARGLWQLMPGTAREYGLIVNGRTDQRLDVVLSTEAAAKYLRDLYAEFGNWKLAVAAYNAGDKAVHRAMARTGGDGFATASIALPAETQSYVPAVFDALGWFAGSGLSASASGGGSAPVAYATAE